MKAEIQQISNQPDGRFTANINFLDDVTGDVLARTSVTAASKDDFKLQIQLEKQRIENVQADNESMKTQVAAAILEIEQEESI
jgi:uncharacterized protein involved in exopolysaccharide biosynthesis